MAEQTLLSWNVNGIRAVHNKQIFLPWLARAAPDILCLQETRAGREQLPLELAGPAGYFVYWHSGDRKGYSGTALLSRTEPLSVEFGLGLEEFDREGRLIIAEYPTFTLLNCYFPNGGRDHSRLQFKLAYYEAFLDKCEQLRTQGRAVIFCGDVNTAHRPIDLANPRANQNTSGFLPVERAWLDRLKAAGYVDTFRHFYPELAGQYTWWLMAARARERNIGWRIDYFFAAGEIIRRVVDAFILPEVTGSDHCPVGIRLEV